MRTQSTSVMILVFVLALLAAAFVSCNEADDTSDEAPAVRTPAETQSDPTSGQTPPPTGDESPDPSGDAEPVADGDAEAGSDAEGADADPGAEGGETPGDEAEDAGDGAIVSSEGGKEIFAEANCTMCHGATLSGGPLGPALEHLSANWDAAKLKQYLNDPTGYAESDPRLSKSGTQYAMPMPAWNSNSFSEDQLDTLIAWLLEQ